MDYIVFDLEFNQLYAKKNEEINNNNNNLGNNNIIESNPLQNKYNIIDNKTCEMPFEIIQIGAIKLNENLEVLSTFNKLVKPSLYKEIHPFIEDLTGINNEMVKNEQCFPSVYKEFLKFIGSNDFTMCVWGIDDIKQLIRNINFYKLNIHNNIKKYIDIQSLASKEYKTKKGNRLGLKAAVEFWNIPIKNDFHNALNDAIYTTEVFRNIFNKNLKPNIYSNPNYNRLTNKSLKVDSDKLISQFEKIFMRKMTKEERSIIRIAYNMGKTHQFLK